MTDKIGFLGGGRMAEAIFSGALAAGALAPQNVMVCDIDAGRLEQLSRRYGVATVQNDAAGAGAETLVHQCGVVVLAVKPQYARPLLARLAPAMLQGQLAVSIIGGLPLATLEQLMPGVPLIRVMPNTPALVRKGSTGVVSGTHATPEHLAKCRELFDAVGTTYVLPESLIDPLTAVSGCGPAFACLFIEALADGGVEQGLPRETAVRLAAEMLAGTAEMVLQTGQHPAKLKDDVTSPGGGTIAGVHALEAGAFRATVMDAVSTARKRMEKLGK